MQLYTLLFGKSKKKKRPIMVDSLAKCTRYMQAREVNVHGWHEIIKAEPGAVVWKQDTATVGGNKPKGVLRVGEGPSGYIDKQGFHEHT